MPVLWSSHRFGQIYLGGILARLDFNRFIAEFPEGRDFQVFHAPCATFYQDMFPNFMGGAPILKVLLIWLR